MISCTLVVSTFHHFSLHGRVGILWSKPIGFLLNLLRWESSPLGPAIGPVLREHSWIPPSFPHSHYSSNSAGNCVEGPCHVDSVYNGYDLLHTHSLPCCTGTLPGPETFAACAPCYPSATSNSSLSVSYTAKVLPRVILLFGSLVYKNIFLGVIPVDGTISFVTLNHFTVPKTLLP